jgi:hypothetical protein
MKYRILKETFEDGSVKYRAQYNDKFFIFINDWLDINIHGEHLYLGIDCCNNRFAAFCRIELHCKDFEKKQNKHITNVEIEYIK